MRDAQQIDQYAQYVVRLAIFDTTREPDTNTTRKNWVWVCYNRVRVIIGLTRQPDYDPIARVDPITLLPANTIITRLPGLTRQHDYNSIKKKIEG
jgi:hypothetical protein